MDLRSSLKQQSIENAVVNTADFLERNDKLIDIEVVKKHILDTIQKNYEMMIRSKRFQVDKYSFIPKYKYYDDNELIFRLIREEDGKNSGIEQIETIFGEGTKKRNVIRIYSFIDFERLFNALRDELKNNFDEVNFVLHNKNSQLEAFDINSISRLINRIDKQIREGYVEEQKRGQITFNGASPYSEVIVSIRTWLFCNKNGIIK